MTFNPEDFSINSPFSSPSQPLPSDDREKPRISASTSIEANKPQRLWTVWPGKNRFFCDGFVMLGPKSDNIPCFCVWSLVLVWKTTQVVVVFPYLWRTVTPLLPVLSGLLSLQSLVLLLLVVCTEPGIVPRTRVFELTAAVPEEFTRTVMEKYEDGVMYKECSTCGIFRPPRAHHCR